MMRPRDATAKRPDLQGVRALAVLLVALNHANVPLGLRRPLLGPPPRGDRLLAAR